MNNIFLPKKLSSNFVSMYMTTSNIRIAFSENLIEEWINNNYWTRIILKKKDEK